MYKIIVQNYKRELNKTYNELQEYKVIKDEGQGCIQTFIDCLEDSDDDLLYFEDDAILCKDFEKTFQDVLDNLGKDKLIQLFSLKRVITEKTWSDGTISKKEDVSEISQNEFGNQVMTITRNEYNNNERYLENF